MGRRSDVLSDFLDEHPGILAGAVSGFWGPWVDDMEQAARLAVWDVLTLPGDNAELARHAARAARVAAIREWLRVTHRRAKGARVYLTEHLSGIAAHEHGFEWVDHRDRVEAVARELEDRAARAKAPSRRDANLRYARAVRRVYLGGEHVNAQETHRPILYRVFRDHRLPIGRS